jgi:hypothetical protein
MDVGCANTTAESTAKETVRAAAFGVNKVPDPTG